MVEFDGVGGVLGVVVGVFELVAAVTLVSNPVARPGSLITGVSGVLLVGTGTLTATGRFDEDWREVPLAGMAGGSLLLVIGLVVLFVG